MYKAYTNTTKFNDKTKYIFSLLLNKDYLNFIIKKYGYNSSVFSSILRQTNGIINKTIILEDTEEYFIGVSVWQKLYHICYKNLLMVDIDIDPDTTDKVNVKKEKLEFIKEQANNMDLPIMIYESLNGFHVFVIDKPRPIYDEESFQILTKFNCDILYIVFACIVKGYSIRLNKKGDKTDNLYKLLGFHNVNNKNKNKDLINLVFKHIEYCDIYKNEQPCRSIIKCKNLSK
jgi:hypothetical protein